MLLGLTSPTNLGKTFSFCQQGTLGSKPGCGEIGENSENPPRDFPKQKLVGGWTNPFEKYARVKLEINPPQFSERKFQKYLSCHQPGNHQAFRNTRWLKPLTFWSPIRWRSLTVTVESRSRLKTILKRSRLESPGRLGLSCWKFPLKKVSRDFKVGVQLPWPLEIHFKNLFWNLGEQLITLQTRLVGGFNPSENY